MRAGAEERVGPVLPETQIAGSVQRVDERVRPPQLLELGRRDAVRAHCRGGLAFLGNSGRSEEGQHRCGYPGRLHTERLLTGCGKSRPTGRPNERLVAALR